jgi:hypothetical protein
VQASPALRILASMAPAIAASRSASAKTTNGALPPSSIEQLTIVSAAWVSRIRPTSVEPVKESLRTRGSWIIALTTAPERVDGTTLTTPSGTPASASSLARYSAVSGVSLAGLRITVQPAASAGPILRVAIAAGKFHGVTSTLTPTGWWITRMRLAPDGAVEMEPLRRTASSLNQRKNSAAYVTSPRASGSALPFSATMSRAISSARAVMSSKALRRISPRWRGGVAAQAGAAAWAAATAARPSATVPLATLVSTAPVAGSVTSNRDPSSLPRHAPPMYRSVGTPSRFMAPMIPYIPSTR